MTEATVVTEDYLAENFKTEEKSVQYYENKYELVTRMAFLCGVKDDIFRKEDTVFLLPVIDSLRKNDRAMIVRNLCLLRTAIENNFKRLNDAMYHENRQFYALTE